VLGRDSLKIRIASHLGAFESDYYLYKYYLQKGDKKHA
jgi:hypothetical protein